MDDVPNNGAIDDINRMDPELQHIVPDDHVKPYNMKQIIARIIDNGDFMEIQEKFAENIIIGLARMNGKSVGIVAQQPMIKAGVLDIDASEKAARFVRFCDCFNIPLVTLVDVEGDSVISFSAVCLFESGVFIVSFVIGIFNCIIQSLHSESLGKNFNIRSI